MFKVYKTPDSLEGFLEICDECNEEINIEAQRKLYKEKDFNCLYCLYHAKRSGCMYRVCPLTPDKAICGCVTLASAWQFTAYEINNDKFTERVNQYIVSCKRRKNIMMTFMNAFHKNTFSFQFSRLNHENTKLLSAVYLLSADKRLWDSVWKYIDKNSIAFGKIKPKHLSADAYTLLCAAKDLYLGTKHFSLSDLSDPTVLDRTGFGLILNAMGIRRYGYNYIKNKAGDMK